MSGASSRKPIEKTDANTRAVFGDYINTYDIQRAVADEPTALGFSKQANQLTGEEGRRSKSPCVVSTFWIQPRETMRFLTSRTMLAAVIAGLIAVAQTRAAAPANDSAADPAYNSGWPDGSNGGFGFTPWTFHPQGNSGDFIGDSSGNGTAPSGNINTNDRAFGLFANGGGSITETRSFTVGGPNDSDTLGIGQTFSLQMDNGFIDGSGNGFVGFTLLDTFGITVFQFGFFGGQNTYVYYSANGGYIHTNIPFTTDGLTTSLLLGTNNSFTLTVSLNGGAQYVMTNSFGNPNGITAVQLFNDTAGAGSSNDLFFNSLSVTSVPEPGSAALVLVAASFAAAVLAVRRFRPLGLRPASHVSQRMCRTLTLTPHR